jgi:hypothetical protein
LNGEKAIQMEVNTKCLDSIRSTAENAVRGMFVTEQERNPIDNVEGSAEVRSLGGERVLFRC